MAALGGLKDYRAQRQKDWCLKTATDEDIRKEGGLIALVGLDLARTAGDEQTLCGVQFFAEVLGESASRDNVRKTNETHERKTLEACWEALHSRVGDIENVEYRPATTEGVSSGSDTRAL
jgi:hypothetical protein